MLILPSSTFSSSTIDYQLKRYIYHKYYSSVGLISYMYLTVRLIGANE